MYALKISFLTSFLLSEFACQRFLFLCKCSTSLSFSVDWLLCACCQQCDKNKNRHCWRSVINILARTNRCQAIVELYRWGSFRSWTLTQYNGLVRLYLHLLQWQCMQFRICWHTASCAHGFFHCSCLLLLSYQSYVWQKMLTRAAVWQHGSAIKIVEPLKMVSLRLTVG